MMMMMEILGYIFGNLEPLAFFVIIYLLWEVRSQKKWKPIIWILFFEIFLMGANIALKNLFKVPLVFDPTRYGFPSGHIMTFTLMYGWMCFRLMTVYKSFRWGFVITYITILSIGGVWSVMKGFHTWFDILGGFVFGNVWLFLAVFVVRLKRSWI